MSSLARRHRTRILAAAAATLAAASGGAAAARPASGPAATEYELQRARLGLDLRRLKNIQSIEAKIELKRELLPGYDAWVSGVLDAAAAGAGGVQDDILTQIMIWRIDIGDYEGALPLAAYVLRWNLALPERFERTAATLIAEEIAEAALKALGQGEAFPFGLLVEVDDLTADEDMPDQVRAKLNKAMGLELARSSAALEPDADGPAGGKRAAMEGALRRLRRALELNSRAGVKRDIENLERARSKLAAAAPTEGN
jgi:hypothetical protein